MVPSLLLMPVVAVLSSLLPTALVFAVVARFFGQRAFLPLLAIAWLLGQVVVTVVAYLLSCALVTVVSPTLEAAHLVILALETMIGAVLYLRYRKQCLPMLRGLANSFLADAPWLRIASLTAALVFSYFLFERHFFLEENVLYRSKIYWDITAHYPIAQNFVFGDNFPAVDETAAGIPLLYHFFSDLQMAQYVSLGASLPGAFLWISAISLAALLLLAQALAEELFASRYAGIVAALLVVTASDLRWLVEAWYPVEQFLFKAPFVGEVPALGYNVPNYPFGSFNVAMFNLFYFVEERHVVFASALVLLTAYLARDRRSLSDGSACGAGILLALFCGWNIFILPILGMVLLSRVLDSKLRRSALIMLGTLVAINLSHLAYARAVLAASPWFDSSAASPRLNFGFAAPNVDYRITVGRFLEYYAFCLGPTILCAAAGCAILWRRSRADFWLVVPALAITFVLINSLQPMSTSVYENHKWVKPWQGLLNLAAAGPVAILLSRRRAWAKAAGVVLLMLLTLPGVPEALPFFKRGSKVRLAEYPSKFVQLIRQNTSPREVFATQNPREILLAGRKIYYLNNNDLGGTIPHLRGLRFKFSERLISQMRLYTAMTEMDFCSVARELGVQVVEFSPEQQWFPIYSKVKHQAIFTATPEGELGVFSYVSTRECPASR